jgi:hypothetical protein
MTAALIASTLVRRRRSIIALASTTLAATWLIAMAVVVVAMGGTPPPAELAVGLGIPPTVMDAYQRAAMTEQGTDCGLRWQVLAGIGRVESNHAHGRTVDTDGSITPPIIGPILDGEDGTALVVDTDGGTLDGDASYDHAVGPMQFLPSSWLAFGADGDGDGAASPHNVYDAALSALRHLCTGGVSLDTDTGLTDALFSYNHSQAYVDEVMQWIRHYDQAALAGAGIVASPTGELVDVRGIRVDASLAAALERLLEAADAEGLVLSGGGYRTRDEQIALRRAHCGTSDYAIFEIPADACSPPTARPGQSMHELGLAIDFTCGEALVSRSDRCFVFLSTHGAAYGLHNLETEPWHWSTNGR